MGVGVCSDGHQTDTGRTLSGCGGGFGRTPDGHCVGVGVCSDGHRTDTVWVCGCSDGHWTDTVWVHFHIGANTGRTLCPSDFSQNVLRYVTYVTEKKSDF